MSCQSGSFLIICHIEAFRFINCKCLHIQTARSTSRLLSLHSEILNISCSPHEFKMHPHISAASLEAVGAFQESAEQEVITVT